MFPAVISVNMVVKFKNGIIAINGVVVIPIIKAIIPGNKDIMLMELEHFVLL